MNNPSAEGLPVVIESSDSFDSGIKSSSRSPSLTSIDRWPIFFSSSRKARPERNFPKRKLIIHFHCFVDCKFNHSLSTIILFLQNHSSLNYTIEMILFFSKSIE